MSSSEPTRDDIQPYESLSHWLNRSNLPQAEHMRAVIEEWFTKYPTSQQAALRGPAPVEVWTRSTWAPALNSSSTNFFDGWASA